MAVAQCVTQLLDAEGVKYSIDHHSPCFTSQTLAAEENTTGYRVVKTVVAIADGRPVILALPAPFVVDVETCRKELEAKTFRLADPSEIPTYFHGIGDLIAPPPLAIWPGVKVHADETLWHQGDMLFAAGSHRDAVRMKVSDWLKITQPTVGKFAIADANGEVVTETWEIETDFVPFA